MNRRALRTEERLDLRGATDEAIDRVRTVLEISTAIGPVLVVAFRAMSVLRELRDTIDELSEIEREREP
jgi:hypothetical protein